MNTGLISGTRK